MVERTVASFDGTPLHVQVIDDAPGTDRPDLMLVNGLGATIVTWRLVIARFRKAFRIVCFDTRGLHRSGRPLGGKAALDVVDHARDVVAVADAVGFTRFHAMGWSMGVQVLVEATRLLGDRLITLCLHNGVAGRAFADVLGSKNVGRLIEPMLAGVDRNVSSFGRPIERAVAAVVDHRLFVIAAIRLGLAHHDIHAPTFRAAAAGFKQVDVDVFLTILRHLGRHDGWDALPLIQHPVFVVAGSNDRMTPLSTMQRMAKHMPRGELSVLSAGTHYAALELPDLFHEALLSFWQRHGVLGESA
ncbi:MAG: alpha/beta hydrolase [Deltaproteobacteria bacterium]|nr:alpha/beta hydrolase [Deltaproteobacteria bacterium]